MAFLMTLVIPVTVLGPRRDSWGWRETVEQDLKTMLQFNLSVKVLVAVAGAAIWCVND